MAQRFAAARVGRAVGRARRVEALATSNKCHGALAVGAQSRTDAAAAHEDEDLDHASLGSRVAAYVIDSIALAGLSLLFFAASGLNVYLSSDGGRESLSDAAITDSFIILMATIPVWVALNLILAVRRGQSLGKYVVGLQAVRLDGRPAGLARHLVHWIALHPLLFHPLIGLLFAGFAVYSVSFAESSLLLFGGMAVTLLCFLGPAAVFVFALGDGQRRGLHDWIAAMKVVRIE